MATTAYLDYDGVVTLVKQIKNTFIQLSAIDDTTASTSGLYSSSKIESAIEDAKTQVQTAILGGAGEAYDTLKELYDLLTAGDTDLQSIVNALTYVSYGDSQTLTDTQQTTARTNIGAASASDVSTLESTVSSYTTSIASNTSSITDLTTRMTTAEGNISTNTSDIDALETSVTTNTNNISTLQSNVATNTTNISTNTTNIAANASDIDALETSVADLTTTVESLKAASSEITALTTAQIQAAWSEADEA